MFEITREGRYTIPNWGQLDTSKEVSNERLLALYQYKGFPWITLVPGDKTVKFLKKQKLTVVQLSQMILKATTKEEIEVLLQVNSAKALKGIADTRLKAILSK